MLPPGTGGEHSCGAKADVLPPVVERHPGSAAGDAVVARVDALAAARALGAAEIHPRLVYLDPPFAADRDFVYSPRQVPADASAACERVAFRDRWDGGLDAYLAFMEPILNAVRDLLTEDGSLLLHCDHRASPYLAVLCDRIFGLGDRGPRPRAPGFRNELIWSYGLGGSSPRAYPKKHDTILWYSRGSQWFFEPPRVPATSMRMRGQLKKAPDVLAIASINNMAAERTGYPTQKPLALLDLLVRAHSEPGDLVADLFCGSGTTGVAAARCDRRVWVSDQGADAVAVARERLLDLDVGVTMRSATTSASSWPIRRAGDRWHVAQIDDMPLESLAIGAWHDGCLDVSARWSTASAGDSSTAVDAPIQPADGALEIHGTVAGFSVRDAAGRAARGPLPP